MQCASVKKYYYISWWTFKKLLQKQYIYTYNRPKKGIHFLHAIRLQLTSRSYSSAYVWIRWFGGEFVPLLALIVVELHNAVHRAHGELFVVRRPCDGNHFCGSVLHGGRKILILINAQLTIYRSRFEIYHHPNTVLQLLQLHALPGSPVHSLDASTAFRKSCQL